ncbi:MAG TPA: amidohydrolase family protein [Alphaproteobacteria bacterium]|nr:amidohydrolase family protein [Alphaproteobacteria bacterium]
MSSTPDLVIRGGTIADGSGGALYEADLAVSGGKISAIGQNLPKGEEEIDAKGKLVTPGFVDVHTHYDAQVTWSNRISPSSWNGVTTVMVGNCGVGFAPCKPHQRDELVELMEGVEDIPEVVLTEGLPWNWETFGEYLDSLDGKRFDLDVVTQVPHAALRVYVMGERGVAREDATAEDRAAMARLAAEGIRAGALGFSTSRTINHRTVAGAYTPTLGAAEQELVEIARAVGETGSGWLQVISDFDEPEEEMAMLRRMARASGRPMTMTVLELDKRPDVWRRTMAGIAEANAAGERITGQVLTRPIGLMLGFEISLNPFMLCDSWKQIEHLSHPEKIAALRDPAFKERLLTEFPENHPQAFRVANFAQMFPLGDPPNYEPDPATSIAAEAARQGRKPHELAFDLLMEKEGKAILFSARANYAQGNLESVREMMSHPNTLVGLGDGGAHVGVLTDASAMTYLLTHWTRDRTRGEKLPVEWAVKRLSRDNAHAIGLSDRGELSVGKKADINVIDYDSLAICPPEVLYDLPAGGKRMVQRIQGYDATIVSGQAVYRNGEATDALPGRLVRGASR